MSFRKFAGIVAVVLIAGAAFGPSLANAQEAAQEAAAAEPTALERFDKWVGEQIVARLAAVLFYPVPVMPASEDADRVTTIPLVVTVLVFGGIFFTLRYKFVNVRLFWHSFDVVRGRYDRPGDTGEVSHFKALTSALSGTVGLGNIAGVSVAIALGGPGAVFWMWMTAIFGMTLKYSECLLAQMYRRVSADGRVLGGPMMYLHYGLPEVHPMLKHPGRALAILFAILTIFAAFGGGNMFQSNQTVSLVVTQFFDGSTSGGLRVVLGSIMAFLVAIVIIGGIQRIGEVTARMVPAMCLGYSLVCIVIIVSNFPEIPHMFLTIFQGAFTPEAGFGGFIGVLVQGMRRAAFSNEAGLGSAAIAHAAAKTEEPVREGVVALLEPFIDTICVCTMTALAILVTQAHLSGAAPGVDTTLLAFKDSGFMSGVAPYLLTAAVFVFAYSTIISWGYYGERAVEYLVGLRGIMAWRIVYVLMVVVGPMLSLTNIIDFSDMLLLSMAFPNILGMILLSGKVKALGEDYIRRLRSGEMKPEW